MKYLYTLFLFLSFPGIIWAQQTLRLTDQLSDKPCIIVNATGSHVVWMEVHDDPPPEETTYLIKTHDIKNKTTASVLRVPGIRSNVKMQLLIGDKPVIRGPEFKTTDLNYRIAGDNMQVRLSGDGRYLAACVKENHDTVKRTPFFVIIDLKKQSFESIPVHIPKELGSISGNQITSQLNLQSWDFSPDGQHLAYVLDAVNYRGSSLILYNIEQKTSRRLLGYEKAEYVNGTLTIDGPADQLSLVGRTLHMGNNILVISGKNSQGQDGFWITDMPRGTSLWHGAAHARPGIARNHVFYKSQKPAIWLNADGSETLVFEQMQGIINYATWPFWSNNGSAYVLDHSFSKVLELGNKGPLPVINKADLGILETWKFQFQMTSSADSYRLVSDDGGTLVLPVYSPDNQRRLDLVLLTRATVESFVQTSDTKPENSFNSLIDAFEVKSLLKPGELSGKFMPENIPSRTKTVALPDLPPPWKPDQVIMPEPVPMDLNENAQTAHDEAVVQLMLGELDDANLTNVIERLEKAVDLDPANPEYRLDLADAYIAANTMISVGAGIEQYHMILENNQKNDNALAGLADAYMQIGNLDKALETAYLRIIQNPDEISIRHSAGLQMGVLAIESEDFIAGLTWLRKVYEQYPEDNFVQGFIGLMWELQGDSRRAQAIFDRILKQADTDDPVYHSIKRMKQAIAQRGNQS